MKFNCKALLKNKIVLYIVAFFAITNLMGYVLTRNYYAALLFVAVGLIANQFSKNMTVILGISLIVTKLLYDNRHVIRGLREGLENKGDSDGDSDEDSSEDISDDGDSNSTKKPNAVLSAAKEQNKKIDNASEKKTKQFAKGADGLQSEAMTILNNKGNNCKSNNDCGPKYTCINEKCQIKSSFQNLKPASYPNADKGPPDLEKADELEAVYDHLENVIGSDKIRSMTGDTQQLVEQQKELINQIKDIAPLVENVTKMVGSFDADGKIQGMINSLTKNMSSLSASKVPVGAQDPSPE